MGLSPWEPVRPAGQGQAGYALSLGCKGDSGQRRQLGLLVPDVAGGWQKNGDSDQLGST